MPSPEKFGPYIRKHRLWKRMILRDFAIATELDTARISQLERHATRRGPRNYEVKIIASVLNIDVDLLMRLAEDFAPDMEAIKSDKEPLKNAVFVCRTEE